MSVHAPSRFLFVAQDAGGFNAILPVYKKLKQELPRSVFGLFGDVSRALAQDRRLPFVNVDAVTSKTLERLFELKKPDILVVGTSSGLSIDKLAVSIAKRRSIPSVAIMDFWSNYNLRFSDPGTKNRAYTPDKICVMDRACKQDLVKDGFEVKRIIITGNPYFDSFFKALPKARGKKIISFFSQPFSELKKEDNGFDFGYDERDVLKDVVDALTTLCVGEDLVIKHHPRTKNRHVFDEIIRNPRLAISIDTETTSIDMLARSRLVIGMNSVILFEAALRGCSVLSYQPHLCRPDPLMSNRLGLSTAVYEKSNLKKVLQSALDAGRKKRIERIRDQYVNRHATQKVIHLLRSIK